MQRAAAPCVFVATASGLDDDMGDASNVIVSTAPTGPRSRSSTTCPAAVADHDDAWSSSTASHCG